MNTHRVGSLFSAAVIVALPVGAATPPDDPAIPETFSSAPAVVLEDRTRVWTDANRSGVEHRVKIKIVNRAGYDLADQVVYYDRKRETLEGFRALTRLPDGRVVPVPEELARDVVAMANDAAEYHAVHFSFAAVVPGCTVEWEYVLARKEPTVIDTWTIQRDVPVLSASYALEVRGAWGALPTFSVGSRSDLNEYCAYENGSLVPGTVQCRNVPAFRPEGTTAPHNDRRITATVWMEFPAAEMHRSSALKTYLVDTWRDRYDECTKRRSEAERAAESLRADKPTEPILVDRVFDLVRERVRLTESSTEREWFSGERPCASPDEVLARGGGSSDEIVFLTLVLLRSAGVPSQLAIVNDRSDRRFEKDLPDPLQYRDPLIRIGSGASGAYLDPACDYCQAGLPDWRHSGYGAGGVLVPMGSCDGKGTVAIPAVKEILNSEIVQQTVRLDAEGAADVEGTVVWQGQSDVEQRRKFEDLTAEGRKEEFLSRVVGRVENATVEISDPEDRRNNMRAQFRFLAPDLAFAYRGKFLVRPPDRLSSVIPFLAHPERDEPLWFPFPESLSVQTVFALPGGYEVRGVPHDVVLEAPGLRFDSRWTRDGDTGGLVWSGRIRITDTVISAADYGEVREFASGVRNALREGAVLAPVGQPSMETEP